MKILISVITRQKQRLKQKFEMKKLKEKTADSGIRASVNYIKNIFKWINLIQFDLKII